MAHQQYVVGIDLGTDGGTAYTIGHMEGNHFVVDFVAPAHQRTKQAFEKELSKYKRQRDRSLWGKKVIVDLRVHQTRGDERRKWLKTQLYLQLGRIS